MGLEQVAYSYAPGTNWLFHSESLGQDEWVLTLAGGVLICGVARRRLLGAMRIRQ